VLPAPAPDVSPALAPAVDSADVPEGIAPDEAASPEGPAPEEVTPPDDVAGDPRQEPRRERVSRRQSQKDNSRRIPRNETESAQPTSPVETPDDGLPDFGGRR